LNSTWLDLIGGNSNGENVPLGSLFVRARNIDVVIAVDDTVRRTSLKMTSRTGRQCCLRTAAFKIFYVNQRPTFFGCDPPSSPPGYPPVIQLSNSPPNNGDKPITNLPTFQLSYTNEDVGLFLDQVQLNTAGGFVPNATGTDPNWDKCLQCAALGLLCGVLQAVLLRPELPAERRGDRRKGLCALRPGSHWPERY